MTTKCSTRMTNKTTTKEPNQYSHRLSLPWIDNPTTGVGEGETVIDVDARPKQNVGTYKDGPAIIRRLPIDREEYDLHLT